MAFANLGISLTANTRGLQKGLRRARGMVKTFGGRIRKMVTSTKTLFAGLAAGAGTALASASINSVDALGKMASRLGIATEKLGALRHAARLSGVGIAQMDIGLQRMIRRVSEAAAGTGEAQDAIKELGLDAVELAAMSPDEQFLAITNAMRNVENQSDRVRLAFKLFDSEGVALVNTMRLLEGDGFRKVEKEARRLGVAMTRAEVNKFEQAKDNLERMKVAFQGMTILLIAKALPIINKIANFLERLFSGTDDANEKVKKQASWWDKVKDNIGLAWKKAREFATAVGQGDFKNAFSRAAVQVTQKDLVAQFGDTKVDRALSLARGGARMDVGTMTRTSGGKVVDLAPILEEQTGWLKQIAESAGEGNVARAGR